jgi:hypothetical protein
MEFLIWLLREDTSRPRSGLRIAHLGELCNFSMAVGYATAALLQRSAIALTRQFLLFCERNARRFVQPAGRF